MKRQRIFPIKYSLMLINSQSLEVQLRQEILIKPLSKTPSKINGRATVSNKLVWAPTWETMIRENLDLEKDQVRHIGIIIVHSTIITRAAPNCKTHTSTRHSNTLAMFLTPSVINNNHQLCSMTSFREDTLCQSLRKMKRAWINHSSKFQQPSINNNTRPLSNRHKIKSMWNYLWLIITPINSALRHNRLMFMELRKARTNICWWHKSRCRKEMLSRQVRIKWGTSMPPATTYPTTLLLNL